MNFHSPVSPRRVAPFAALVLLVGLTLAGGSRAGAQQQQPPPPAAAPSPSPARTGRSYSIAEPPKSPPPTAPQAQSPVTFTDATAQTSINFRHAASPTSQKYLMETMGAGVALFDYDNDGRLDLYFTNGARIEDPMPKGAVPDKRDQRYWNRLYRQKADGTFEDATERAGLKGEGYSMGAAAGDYDNDGFTDLYVTAYGGAILYRNRGDGTFEDTTRKAGAFAPGWPTSAGWLDYDRDGRLDLFVVRYMDWDFERGALVCGEPRPGYRAYCHPDNFTGASNILFRQKPDGTFEDVTKQAGINDPEGKGLGCAFADFDGDGWTDIFVANDSVRQQLFRGKGDGTFEDIALISGTGYDENGKTFAGMGVDAADFDNDGHPDVFLTALSNETYPLYRNNGDQSFTYVTQTSGVAQITLLYSGWGTRFADFDNDGRRDLFVAQSHVLDTIEKTTTYLKYKQSPLLMRNAGPFKGRWTFQNVSASAGPAFQKPLAARGLATGDLDSDGDTDLVIAQTDGPPLILRNDGTKNRWLGLSLQGTKSHRGAAGARVVVTDATGRRQTFDVTNAGSYLSSHDPRLIVGLGAATSVASVEIRWPGGQKQTMTGVAIDRYVNVKEP
ncbi:MAG: CRTAC1 family protein [Pyrinomonadaceae bacterium]